MERQLAAPIRKIMSDHKDFCTGARLDPISTSINEEREVLYQKRDFLENKIRELQEELNEVLRKLYP